MGIWRNTLKTIITDQHERVGRWVCERTKATYSPGVSMAIGLEENGILIAGVMYDNYRKKSIAMHVAGEGKNWLNRNYLRVCFDYPFNQLKVNKIIGLVGEDNMEARRFDEHLGFRLETVILDACEGGSLLIYSMTREQCKYLGVKNGQTISACCA